MQPHFSRVLCPSQAAADASAALSKVAAELEDMDIGDHGDIGDLISQVGLWLGVAVVACVCG